MISTSLDAYFNEAIDRQGAWSEDRLLHALQECSRHVPGAWFDWEPGDENWGRVLIGGRCHPHSPVPVGAELVAFISVKVPFVFVLSKYHNVIHRLLEDCVIVPVKSTSVQKFSVDPALLQQISDRPLTPDLDYDRASIEDIWYATI